MQEKSACDFPKNASKSDGLGVVCLICQRAYNAEHYRNNKDQYVSKARRRTIARKSLIASLKHKPCAECGGVFITEVMDFDHVSGDKLFEIARGGLSCSNAAFMEEIAKCEVVCANCHRIRTWRRRQNLRD